MLTNEQKAILTTEELKVNLDMLKDFTVTGIKTLLLLNGGASVAILAFLGGIINTNDLYSKWILGTAWTLTSYAIGMLLAGVTALIAYIAQALFCAAIISESICKFQEYNIYANCLRVLGLLISFSSLVTFVIGSIIFFYTITGY